MNLPNVSRSTSTQPAFQLPPRVANVRAVAQPGRTAPPAGPQVAPQVAPPAEQRPEQERIEGMHDALARRMARIKQAHASRAESAPAAAEKQASPNTADPKTVDGPNTDGPNAARRHGSPFGQWRRMLAAYRHSMQAARRPAPAVQPANVPAGTVVPNVASGPVQVAPTEQKDGGEPPSGKIFHDLMKSVHTLLGAYSQQISGEESALELRGLGERFDSTLRDIFARLQSGELDDTTVHEEISAAFQSLVGALGALPLGSGGTVDPTDPAGPVNPVPPGVELPGGVPSESTAPAAPEFQSGAQPAAIPVEPPSSSEVPNVASKDADGPGQVQKDRLRLILHALSRLRENAQPIASKAPAGGPPVENRLAAARSAFADLRDTHDHPNTGGRFNLVG
jgi:hypothetical protein